ncbi:MAG TPA: flagellar assembly protein FliW [Bryobacteraceae bacterium]|nr:flagellar assembly protein FliW [Bryobacteraceae bacterium]
MPRIPTKFFGDRECDADSIYTFPAGLPGFEDQHSFCFLTTPASEPLLFMQSIATPNLCFVMLPILVVDPDYRVALSEEELATLELPSGGTPAIGRDILCAALVCSEAGTRPTVNLMAPIVVNLKTKAGIQVIHGESGYSHRHPLRLEEELVAC